MSQTQRHSHEVGAQYIAPAQAEHSKNDSFATPPAQAEHSCAPTAHPQSRGARQTEAANGRAKSRIAATIL